MKIKFFILLIVTLSFYTVYSQASKLDSLIIANNNMPNDSSKVLDLISISNKFRTEKIKHDSAILYAKKAQELSKKIGFNKGFFKALIAIAYATRDKGLHIEGINILKDAILFFERDKFLQTDISMHTSWVYTYTALADLYTYLPDYKNAQNFAFKAIDIAEKNNQVGIGQCWITLSIIFFKEKNFSQANYYAKNALAYFQKNNSLDDIARVYAYLARYANTQKDYQTALDYYLKSYNTYAKAKSNFGMRIASYNMAEINLQLKNFTKANEYIQETVRLNNEANDLLYMFFINDLKFKIEFENKQYAASLVTAKKLLQYANNEKNLTNISLSYSYLKQAYLALKDTPSAFLMVEKIGELKDSIYNADLAKSTDELARKYETKSKEERINFLNANNLLQQEKLAQEAKLIAALQSEDILKQEKIEQDYLLNQSLIRENNIKQQQLLEQQKLNKSIHEEQRLLKKQQKNELLIQRLFISLSIAAMLIGCVIFIFYLKQKKANHTISQQRFALETLLQEVHHRTKNNLQIMLSIMRMQKRNVQDEHLLDVLAHSESRLQSMAIIHEKLYKNNEIGVISLKEYIEHLANVLLDQFSFNKKVKLVLTDTTNQLQLNLDTTIALGLIINEVLTNSLKYAFINESNPEINISINIQASNKYNVTITDNGIGFNESEIMNRKGSIGLKLIKLLSQQINGKVEFNKVSKGSSISILFTY